MDEIWKDIPGYEGKYQVSNLGRVKTLRIFYANGWHAEKIRAVHLNNFGYFRLNLRKDGRKKSFQVHTLVALAFIGPCPAGKEINHKNGVITDNKPDNLEYCTHGENMTHKYRVLGVKPNRNNVKLTEEDVRHIRKLFKPYEYTYPMLAKKFGVTVENIQSIIYRRTWKHISP